MAQAILPAGYSDPKQESPQVVELKEPAIAALLTLVLPGLGHLYQGRTGKGILFFVCVFGTFLFGMWIGGGRVVYASTPGQQPWRWQYICQLGMGAPALPALVQRQRVMSRKQPYLSSWGSPMAPHSNEVTPWKDYSGNVSQQPDELAAWTVDGHPRFEVGTVYTVIAGLLNVLVVCDAFAGPLVLHPRAAKPPTDDDKTKNNQ